jgi:uncharacterized flavoprotein (TIGR03862 family)
LRAWLARLRANGVQFMPRHRWIGWNAHGALTFATPEGSSEVAADAAVLALGGASWPKLGSDGGWQEILRTAGIEIAPLVPANCGFIAGWTSVFSDRFQGQPLKGIELCFGGQLVRGELIVTKAGLEGGAIYTLSPLLRETILREGKATLVIDLRPDVPENALAGQLGAARGKQSLSSFLRKTANLSPVAIGLLQETAITRGQRLADMAPGDLAVLIKQLPVVLTGVAPIERAISTAGGVRFDEIDENYMLLRKPGTFVAGEMLDWEAPTGGYLLQACFATGAAAGRGALDWLMKAH